MDPRIDRPVAIKVLRSNSAATDAFKMRFLKEARAIGRLSHPNIVTIYDVEDEQGDIYIAMEYLEGMPLADLLKQRRPDVEEAVRIGIQMAETIGYAHSKGVIHRDIKPSNIMVDAGGRITITDFGIARIEDSSDTLMTQAGQILGTPAYMSPEQTRGQVADKRSDIFAIGVVLYEMAAGNRPFGGDGKSLATILSDILLTVPPAPHTLSPFVPKDFSDLIMKTLQKEPEKRFQTCGELEEALRRCLQRIEAPIKAKRSDAPKGSKIPRYAILTVLALMLAGGSYLFYPRHPRVERNVTAPAVETSKPPETPPAAAPASERAVTVKPTETPQSPPFPVAEETAAANPSEEKMTPKGIPAPTPPRVEKKPATVAPPADANKRPAKPEVSRPEAIRVPIAVKSDPQGARIYIDGALKGTTPATLMIPTGEHSVRLTLQGYRDAEKRVTIEETMEYPLSFRLKSLTEAAD
jgi:serine/threonine-protein kinase